MSELLSPALKNGIRKSGAPGAVALVGRGEKKVFFEAVGFRQIRPKRLEARENTIYDLASLTKVIATAPAVMQLVGLGEIRLDDPLYAYLPLPSYRQFTIRQMLTHTSGLPATMAIYNKIADSEDAFGLIAEAELVAPPNSRRIYSDIGYILLARLVELVSTEPFDAYCRRNIFAPLKMNDTMFNPPADLLERIAPTEDHPQRGAIHGAVHDDTAFALGGIAGHAGLFSTAEDIEKFCRGILSGALLKPEALSAMIQIQNVPFFPWQGLGWRLDPWLDSAEGFLPSRRAFGHTGWTGTSMWIDPETQTYSILLSNTCHPVRAVRDNRTLRRTWSLGLAAAQYPGTRNTHNGFDRAMWDNFERFSGKRLGLLVNSAATDAHGRPVHELMLRDSRVSITRLFSPEHGLRLQAAAGEQVSAQTAAVPVVSLYGEKKRPAPEDLAGLDLFVVDLPDVGARYYTYLATIKDCLEACAAARVPVVVLDRPNPLGGEVLEGPIAERTESLVCWGAVPIRHGMTAGEACLYLQRRHAWGAQLRLEVMPCDLWTRELMHHQTQRPWIAPSPNLATADTALMYVGTCLVEGTNLNEGRGTDQPFLQFGAPWLDAEEIVKRAGRTPYPGVRMEAIRYTPVTIPGKASSPVHEGQTCRGIRFEIMDRQSIRPFSVVVDLLSLIRERHRKEFEFKSFFDTLAGGPWLRQQLESGARGAEITAALAPSLEKFAQERPKLYETGETLLREALA